MKNNFFNLILIIISFFYSCRNKELNNDIITKNGKISENSKDFISVDTIDSYDSLLHPLFNSSGKAKPTDHFFKKSGFQKKLKIYTGIKYFHKLYVNTKSDSIKYIFKNFNEYYYSNYSPVMYRFNKRGNFFIEYNAITHDNILYDINLNKYGTIKLEANNPEFSIETIPLEDESGMLFFDGIYGFEKFELVNNYLKSKFKNKLNNSTTNIPYIIKDQNKLIILEKNYKNKAAQLLTYSLENGSLLSSKKIDYFLEPKYFVEGNLLVLFYQNKINVMDLNDSKEFKINLSTDAESFVIKKENGKIFGFCKTNNIIVSFKEQNNILDTTNYRFNSKYQLVNPVIVKDLLAYSYFETKDTNGKNYSKRIGQGIIFFKPHSTYIFQFPLSEMLLNLSIIEDKELVIGNSFRIYIENLIQLL